MTDWSRLVDYINNYFPDPTHSSQDIRDWAEKSVPPWKNMGKGEKDKIIKDWEYFIEPQVKGWFRRMSSDFGRRIKAFLGRLY